MSDVNERPTSRLIDAIETAYGEMLKCDGVGDVYPHLLAARKAAEAIDFRERVDANFRTLFDAVNDIERRLSGEAR